METEEHRPAEKPGKKLMAIGIALLLGGIVLFVAGEPLSKTYNGYKGVRVVDDGRLEIVRFVADKVSWLGAGLIVASTLVSNCRRPVFENGPTESAD